MEYNCQEDSKSSSEESDRSVQIDDMGTGRSYECVYCKRGFTTAQALGGHMNIHRKDRVKTRPSSVPSVSSKADENYVNLRSYTSIQSYPPHYNSTAPEVQVSSQVTFPVSAWHMRPPNTQHTDHVQNNPLHPNLFEEDWRRSLSLQVGPTHVVVEHDREKRREDGSEEDDELDLELRLGHYP
ncbi:transcriptional regulator SUPERMAN [Quercus suber]|uniref:Transcriptional regulator tac1 n=1 Tax=Quercus suber TaxID=58331 RepID=A0AAW0KJT7_QUESU|nr:transcriptional regulator SUPERMAN-like [Quercus suber]POE82850.1 transcriptional regulator tac1 [Quercus suber]